MSTRTSRRGFLASTSLLSASLGVGGVAAMGELSPSTAADVKLMSSDLKSEAGVERVAQLIDETPREKAVGVMVEELQRGVGYRQFLAGMFVAASRFNSSPHKVMMINAAHRLSLDMPRDQMLLPLFWALDTLLHDREEGPRYKPFQLTHVSPADADKEVIRAMNRYESEPGLSALIALSRTIGPRQAIQRLCRYAGRDFSYIGHRAIVLANAWRLLETVGWFNAEPVFEFVVRQLNGGGGVHWCHRVNTDRCREVTQLPADWTGDRNDTAATQELLSTMRTEDHFAASQLAWEMLKDGKVQAKSIWDAVYLIGGEFMMSYPNAKYIRAAPLHTNTSSQALRAVYDRCTDPEIRVYTLLQAVAWSSNFFNVGRERDNLRNLKITEIPEVEIPEDLDEAVQAIFKTQPRQQTKAASGSGSPDIMGTREEMDLASHMAFAFGRQHTNHSSFLNAARAITSIKATKNTHDVKYPAAMFDTYRQVSPEWRPHLLAASMHHLHSSKMVDNPAMKQARELLAR